MALTTILIDYDLTTCEIRRIIVPDDDSQLLHHPPQTEYGWGRATMPAENLPDDPAELGRSSLAKAAVAVEAATGVWPPNVKK